MFWGGNGISVLECVLPKTSFKEEEIQICYQENCSPGGEQARASLSSSGCVQLFQWRKEEAFSLNERTPVQALEAVACYKSNISHVYLTPLPLYSIYSFIFVCVCTWYACMHLCSALGHVCACVRVCRRMCTYVYA